MTASITATKNTRQEHHIPCAEKLSKEEVLAFEFPDLVERLEDKLHLTPTEARGLYRDLLEFLFLCGFHRGKGPFGPPEKIDNAWHEFLMFTRQYAEFCHKHFGSFIHHVPFTRRQKALGQGPVNAARTAELARREFGTLSSNWRAPAANCGKCSSCEGDCCPIHD